MSIACNPEINTGAKLHTALTIHRNGNELAYWGDWGAVYIAPVTYILSSPRNESRKWNIMLHWIHRQHIEISDVSRCFLIFTAVRVFLLIRDIRLILTSFRSFRI